MSKGPCKKQIVTAVIIALDGQRFYGENDCDNPQDICPRLNLPTGIGYHLCRDICKQHSHAEINALKTAGKSAIGATLYLTGHTYACNSCQDACNSAGIVAIIIGTAPEY